MIKILKSKVIPAKLQTSGKAENDQNKSEYDLNSKLYANGTKKFKIKGDIYKHISVKSALKDAQGGDKCKCCFCEKSQTDEYGAVEHYRPKGGYRSTNKKRLVKPGYYWLGYYWENLYFVCSVCNNKKSNLFPLVDESIRAKSHHDNYRKETPLLLDPGGRKNPRKHIVFENQFPVGKSIYGKKTIEICGLDRDALNTKRKEHIDNINIRIVILNAESLCGSTIVEKEKEKEKAKQFIKDSMKEDAEFSATAIDYLKTFGIS